MKVYYSNSLWCKGRGLWGWPQRVNWQFEYAGAKRYIPAVYRFSRGIVFDVISILDEAKLNELMEKHEVAQEQDPYTLQSHILEQEFFHEDVVISRIEVNGKRVAEYSSSGGIYIPQLKQEAALEPMRRAYSFILPGNTHFACQRYLVPYPEASSKFQKLLRFLRLERIESIKFSTFPVQRLYPLDIHFEMSEAEGEREVSFIHPLTGTPYKLYFQNPKTIAIPLGGDSSRQLFVMQAMYEIDPPLPKGDDLQFDSTLRHRIEYSATGGGYFPDSISSFGIIGGADGPTSIFISSRDGGKAAPLGLHGLPLRSCSSVPSFAKEDRFRFHLEGINTVLYHSQEFTLTVD